MTQCTNVLIRKYNLTVMRKEGRKHISYIFSEENGVVLSDHDYCPLRDVHLERDRSGRSRLDGKMVARIATIFPEGVCAVRLHATLTLTFPKESRQPSIDDLLDVVEEVNKVIELRKDTLIIA